jgi:hypothetical protein
MAPRGVSTCHRSPLMSDKGETEVTGVRVCRLRVNLSVLFFAMRYRWLTSFTGQRLWPGALAAGKRVPNRYKNPSEDSESFNEEVHRTDRLHLFRRVPFNIIQIHTSLFSRVVIVMNLRNFFISKEKSVMATID